MKKNLKGILGLFVIFVVIPFGALAILWKDRCKETLIEEVGTEGGNLVAALISTDCGTSMKVATEVRLERREEGKTVAKETVLLLSGSTLLPLNWSDGPTLTIDVPEGVDVVKRRGGWEGVTVVAHIPQKKPE